MGFLDHLDELRMRIIRSCIAIGAGMAVAFLFAERIADFVLSMGQAARAGMTTSEQNELVDAAQPPHLCRPPEPT